MTVLFDAVPRAICEVAVVALPFPIATESSYPAPADFPIATDLIPAPDKCPIATPEIPVTDADNLIAHA